MILSVIIVNYRVPYFLELCLHSVRKTMEDFDSEIIVVDNHSGDGSVDLLRPQFPEVNWIVNTENTGFARANNLGFQQSRGEYILFLNPDTILPEDFTSSCLHFIHNTNGMIGGVGVRMIDGDGQFLKESRRGFPTSWVAFCKLTGLTALFPRSRLFARYYLGHLPATQVHPAPVLSGACLLVSRSALSAAGTFDENFFMYAEDIDLSFRLEKAGYTNFYFPDTTIIHFKGESTSKDVRYIRQFYGAMIQFRRKHHNKGLPRLFRVAAEAAIRLRAAFGAAAVVTGGRLVHGPRASKPRATWLTGDPSGIARLRSALVGSRQRAAAPDERHADEIIYCIGKEFSFKSAINALETKTPACAAAFYFTGGHAVVGSSRRDRRGETWIINGEHPISNGQLPDQAF